MTNPRPSRNVSSLSTTQFLLLHTRDQHAHLRAYVLTSSWHYQRNTSLFYITLHLQVSFFLSFCLTEVCVSAVF